MRKDQLRKVYKLKRQSLGLDELAALNGQIFQLLKQLDWNAYEYVHVYLPLIKFNEPDTRRLIAWLSESHPHINLVISKSDFQQGEMQHYLLDAHTKLVENKWGILEPITGQLLDEKLIDLVLVPLLVVDKQGNRVGYGKGFYDRFLSKCRKDVKTCGICFFEPVDTISDVGPWDISLQACITPNGLYQFS